MGIRIHVKEEDKNESILNPNNLLQFDISIVQGSPHSPVSVMCHDRADRSETCHVSHAVFVMITLVTSHRRLLCLTLLPVSPCPMSVAWDRGGNIQPQLSSGSESRRHNQRAQSDLGLGTTREAWIVIIMFSYSECQETTRLSQASSVILCDSLHIIVLVRVPLYLM